MPLIGVGLSVLLIAVGLHFLPGTSNQDDPTSVPQTNNVQASPGPSSVQSPSERWPEEPIQPLPAQPPDSSPLPEVKATQTPPWDPLAAAEARKQAAFEHYTRLATTGDAQGDINEALAEYREAVRALEELKAR